MIRALIIDDEPGYRKKLRKMVDSVLADTVIITGEAKNVKEGLEAIKREQPGLVFLDIEMPDGTAFDLLEKLGKVSFEIIFTTAHGEHALKAIKFSALDYLIKPVDEEELLKAFKKVEEKKQPALDPLQLEVLMQNMRNLNGQDNQIGLPVNDGLLFVKLNDIIRCQGSGTGGNYSDFFILNRPMITVTKSLKESDELLSSHAFMRIHDSHLINLRQIKKYFRGEPSTVVMSDNAVLPVSRRKKEDFMKRLQEMRLIFS